MGAQRDQATLPCLRLAQRLNDLGHEYTSNQAQAWVVSHGKRKKLRCSFAHKLLYVRVLFYVMRSQAESVHCPSRVALLRQGWAPAAALVMVPTSLNKGGWAVLTGTCPRGAQPRPAHPSHP